MKREKMPRKIERNANIELIRIFACLMVVALHTWTNSGIDEASSTIQGIIRIFLQHGVPLFLMIMGYYLFSSNQTFAIRIKKTFLRIIVPSILTICIYFYLYDWFGGGKSLLYCLSSEKDLYRLFSGILKGDCSAFGGAHLWYVFTYIEIIMAMPILRIMCQNDSRYNYVRWYSMLIAILYVILSNIFYFINGVYDMEFKIYNFSLINRYVLYVLIGYECNLQGEDIIKNSHPFISTQKKLLLCLIIYGLCNMGVCFEELLCLMYFKKSINVLYYSRYSVLFFISSITIFIFLMHMPLKNKKLNAVICFVADKTFYVYLMHYLFVQYVANHSFTGLIKKIPCLIRYILVVLGIFSISLLGATIIKSIHTIFFQIIDKHKCVSSNEKRNNVY